MRQTTQSTVLLVLMLLASALGTLLRPALSLADEREPIELNTMVPTAFGEWREEAQLSAHVINPQQQTLLDKIYSQTLSRTYTNAQGYRIMLSIAYGKNQSNALQMHKPEVCYPSQGFTLLAKQAGALDLSGQTTPITLLSTSLGQRFEPITYWTVVGDYIVTSQTGKKLTELRYALNNRVPDGMLVRISSIDRDTRNAYAMQSQFSKALVDALAPARRARFAGTGERKDLWN